MLNRFKHCLFKPHKALLMLYVLYTLVGLSCGKRMPPLPPIERVPQKAQIQGVQRGSNVLLEWQMPSRNAADGSLLNIDRVDVYRYAEPSSVTLSLTEADFEARSTLISALKLSSDDFGPGKKKTFADKLAFAGQPVRLIYAIRFVNSSGQKAAFSNFLLVEPTSKVANIAENLSAANTEPAIYLKWSPPSANIDGSTPANIVGYNIYRRNSKSENFVQINSRPVSATEFGDEKFDYGETYEYFLRVVSLGVDGENVESSDSNAVSITPKDIFPPSPPESITIAASPTGLSIFFATNPEKDIAGYKIYRSTDKDQDLKNWALQTVEMLKTNTFHDKRVESGKTYYYYLVAIDKFGNVSKNSEIVSETLP